MIQVTGLSYWHNKDKKQVLDNITLEINAGITGLLGANGAGKSTLLKILATALPIEDGSFYYNSINARDNPACVRQVLGYVPQNFTFYHKMTVVQVLKYMSALKLMDSSESNPRINYLLEVFNLLELKHTPFEYLSGGMKQRVGLAQAFLNQPAILLLDEPTQGLDIIEKKSLFALLKDLATQSIVIFSSHYVEELESLCRDIIILAKGTIKYHGSVDQLLHPNALQHREKFSTLQDAFFQLSTISTSAGFK